MALHVFNNRSSIVDQMPPRSHGFEGFFPLMAPPWTYGLFSLLALIWVPIRSNIDRFPSRSPTMIVFTEFKDEVDVASRSSRSCTQKRVTSASSSVHWASSSRERRCVSSTTQLHLRCGRTITNSLSNFALAAEPVSPHQRSPSNSEALALPSLLESLD